MTEWILLILGHMTHSFNLLTLFIVNHVRKCTQWATDVTHAQIDLVLGEECS